MKNRKYDLSDRLLNFAVEVVLTTRGFNESYASRHVAGQLLRAATSAGANYEEACGAESKSDFIHKMQIVLKELRESLYWLRLIERAELDSKSKQQIPIILQETRELANIAAKSIVTARELK